ncbi:MAG: 4-(cytidine 5'-diphospho)-2-C-methyl-D-erythritol kinase [Muribaculaceae bacterium]|nr:4-(cytidine 5'-diphospho)-2-C-methyl-D-erythritol kinase [Muribaculaceae bacterium]
MILFPNAKINLGLNIVAKRPDGYHDIETVMMPVNWCDILEIVPAESEKTTLTITGSPVECSIEDNLVMKAYRAVSDKIPIPPVDIYLEKIIPDGAGLGGGSSDAAFTILGLNDLFNLNLSNETMASIASSLGADCPFFIYNRPMLATGTGTDLVPINVDLAQFYILIAKPDDKVPTREAYANTSPAPWKTSLVKLLNQGDLKHVTNDFEKSIFPTHKNIEQLKNTIIDSGARYASMSGSGSSVYGLFETESAALKIGNELKMCCKVHVGRFI